MLYKIQRRGFSLVEVLVVIAILIILIGLAIFSFTSLNRRQSLEMKTWAVTALIEEARTRALGSYRERSYGIRFETDKVVMFPGEVFDADDAENVDLDLGGRVTVEEVDLGGGREVVFDRLTGEASQEGAVTLGDSEQSKIILIYKSGILKVE